MSDGFERPFTLANHRLWAAFMGVVLLGGPVWGWMIFGPCTSLVSAFPMAAYLALYMYAGIRMNQNILPEFRNSFFWRRVRYNPEGQLWRSRVMTLFWCFPLVGLAFALLGRFLCKDFPR